MATKFAEFMLELRREAKAEGPKALSQLKTLRDRFRRARRLAEARRKRSALMASIQRGLEEAARGETITADELLRRLREN